MAEANDMSPERSAPQDKAAADPKKAASTTRRLTRQELEILRRQLQKKFHRS